MIRCKKCNVELGEDNFLLHIEEKHPEIFDKLRQLDLEQRALAFQEATLIRSIMEMRK